MVSRLGKILFIANECENGGATKSMLKLISLLNKDGVNVCVVTPQKKDMLCNIAKITI